MRWPTAISILVACALWAGAASAQDAAEPTPAEPPPDKLDDLPPIQTEEGKVIPPPPPEVPRMRAPVRPIDATATPPDALVDVIPIPPTDNRTGGERAGLWQPRRNLYTNTGDVIITGSAASVALGMAILAPLDKHPKGGVLYDDAARDALRVRNLDARYMIRDASDVGASLLATWPFLVDGLLTAWWYRGDVKLARNMTLVAAEAVAITAAAQGLTNTFVSRERPYGRLCGGDLPENSVDCEGNVRFRSFFSGHSSIAFTAAGVMCWHHLGLGLIGKPWDAITCVTAYSVAAATATFRIMADMHYATDVTLGAVIGTAVGLVVQWAHLSPPIDDRDRVKPTIQLAPVGQGLGVQGTF